MRVDVHARYVLCEGWVETRWMPGIRKNGRRRETSTITVHKDNKRDRWMNRFPLTLLYSSVRLKFRPTDHLKDGGYLLCLRPRINPSQRWLPAIAGVPGDRGPDDHGKFRPGLAECIVFGRPRADDASGMTLLHEAALRELLPEEGEVEVAVLERVTDFFLG